MWKSLWTQMSGRCIVIVRCIQMMNLGDDVSLNDVWECLLYGRNVYDLLDIRDSEVRVRVFEMISVLKECKYLEIWNLWLTKGEQPLWIQHSKGCIIPKLDLHNMG